MNTSIRSDMAVARLRAFTAGAFFDLASTARHAEFSGVNQGGRKGRWVR
jgi:hypothetical protein